MRGIRFAICPTTIEAAVDAAIGGKTAINIPAGKNLVGAFHAPSLAVIDPQVFGTLAPRDVRAGLAESIKHALLSGDEFVRWHETQMDAILALDPPAVTEEHLRLPTPPW
jgi:3-dehydroquinate synthase